MRTLVTAIIFALPASRIKNRLLNMLGHAIARQARVGSNLVWRTKRVEVGNGGSLGSANVIRGLVLLRIGDHASVGHWNWMTAAAGYAEIEGRATVTLAEGAAVTARHYLDASGGITIGKFATIAGGRSAFWTHGIKWGASQQHLAAISIGEYCLIGSNTIIAPGTVLADRCVVGMGSVLAGNNDQPGKLLLAPRARPVTDVDGEYFSRTTRYVCFPDAE